METSTPEISLNEAANQLPTYEKKALLKNSLDAAFYRTSLILLAVFTAVILAAFTALYYAAVARDREEQAQYDAWAAELAEDSGMGAALVGGLLPKPEKTAPEILATGIPLVLLLLAACGCVLWKYLSSFRDPDNFVFSTVMLGAAERGRGRGAMYYFPIALPDGNGRNVSLRTSKIFGVLFNNYTGYECRRVNAAYNPVTGAVVILGRIG